MVTRTTGEGPILLAKKIGGLSLVILGFLTIATGINLSSPILIVLGTLILAAGVAFLVLKIVRRNQNGRDI